MVGIINRTKCFYSAANVIYQQISRQIRLKIICKVCQIASYIEKGAFYCFPTGDLFWDFAAAILSVSLICQFYVKFFITRNRVNTTWQFDHVDVVTPGL